MVVVPAVIAVTNPVLSTVATAGVEEVHGVVVDGADDPVNWVDNPSHTVGVPVIVGSAFTVTTSVMVHPSVLV
jgi:hypothetical protein